MRRFRIATGAFLVSVASVLPLHAQSSQSLNGDTVSIHLTNVDLRAAVQLLSQYLDRPVVFGAAAGGKVTIETPRAVHRSEVLGLLRSTLESQNLELVTDSTNGVVGPYRIRQKPPHAQALDAVVHNTGGPTQLYVIRLRHARAIDVAATVNALYGRASALGELSAPQPQVLSQQLQQSQVAPVGTPPLPGPSSITNGHSATLSGETTIVPDAGTNSLLIRASPADYALIEAAVKELDIRPLQVLIEVLIVEVRRDRSLSFGVDVALPSAHLPGHPNTTYSGTQSGLDGGDAMLHVLGIGGDGNLAATIRAAASHGDVSILSRPSVLAVNNEEAQINVGSQRPFVQLSRSLPTDSPLQDQVVQYRDVGTKLAIRPTISADGYVMLQVSQEVSAATTEVAFNAPVISTRSVQTQLLLKDGQTVVIGGLTGKQHDVTKQGIPFLSSIPLIGGFFGQTRRETSETELFLFITPHVVKTDEDAAAVTEPAAQHAGVKKHD